MSIEGEFGKIQEKTKESFNETMRMLELQAKNREQAMLLEQQQQEIALLRRRVSDELAVQGADEDEGEPRKFSETMNIEEERELDSVEAELKLFEHKDDKHGRRGFLRAWKRDVEKRAAREASRDPLTNLPNRRTFLDDAHKTLNAVREYLEYQAYTKAHPESAHHRADEPLDQGDFSVVMLDLDHFKQVNDTYGHAAGDEVLKTVADVLRKNLRPTDEIARWGGEEFIVAFKSRNPGARVIVAEKIRRAIENASFLYGEQRLPVTASVGAAKWHLGEDIADVIQSADANLYKAKKEGRNRISIGDVE